MEIRKNEEVNLKYWNDLLISSPFSSPFQTPVFYELYNKTSHFSADVFALQEGKKITGLVVVTIQKEEGIKSYFSRRGIVYGGLLTDKTSKTSVAPLLKYVTDYYKNKLIYIEFRNNFSYKIYSDDFSEAQYTYQPHLNVQLDVTNKSLDNILSLMKYNRRREIRLSIKEGVTVNESKIQSEINQLYDILKELYHTRVKLPLPDLAYFQNFTESPISKVFIVKHHENIIGGAFCITDNTNCINTLYYAGNREYNKKIFPTHMAILGVIGYAIENQIRIVDFMGAGKPDIQYGVRDFKLQFGGKLVEHGRYIKILNPLLYLLGKTAIKTWQKLKK